MDRAKQAVSNIMHKDGKHKTTVQQDLRPAVTEEHIRPEQHEKVTTVIDKDVHQDHHHTTIQPLKAKEILPEKHSENVLPVEHRSFVHENEAELRAKLERDAAKFKDTTVTHQAVASTAAAPTVAAEHVHHHVHEHIQPVIQKETIAPHVVHTTAPIHETHHAHSVHHGTSTLPPKTVEEFTREGGILHGREATTIKTVDGCPQPANERVHGERLVEGDHAHVGSERHGDHSYDLGRHGNHTGTGTSHTGNHSHTGTGTSHTGNHSHNHSNAATAAAAAVTGTGAGTTAVPRSMHSGHAHDSHLGTHGGHTTNTTHHHNTSQHHDTTAKPSLMDKLNPFKDADQDGQKGFMK